MCVPVRAVVPARPDVELRMDGTRLTNRVDGRAISVDPGMHQFSFSARDRTPYTATIMVAPMSRPTRNQTADRFM